MSTIARDILFTILSAALHMQIIFSHRVRNVVSMIVFNFPSFSLAWLKSNDYTNNNTRDACCSSIKKRKLKLIGSAATFHESETFYNVAKPTPHFCLTHPANDISYVKSPGKLIKGCMKSSEFSNDHDSVTSTANKTEILLALQKVSAHYVV